MGGVEGCLGKEQLALYHFVIQQRGMAKYLERLNQPNIYAEVTPSRNSSTSDQTQLILF